MTDRLSRHGGVVALGLVLIAASGTVLAQSRGELLYATHCSFCHTTQVHWRDKRAATDWATLRAQVDRWQSAEALAWNEATVVEVANFLNDTIYRFEPVPGSRSLLPRDGVIEPPASRRSPATRWTVRASLSTSKSLDPPGP